MRRELRFQVAIQQHAHTGGQHQRVEETLIELLPARHVQLPAAGIHRFHRRQRQRETIRQLFAPEERNARLPRRWRGQPIFHIPETHWPFRGRNDGAIAANQFEQPKPVRARHGGSFVVIGGVVRGDGDTDGSIG